MNLIYFIRLLLKNVYLIIGVGILMAVLVYMMTRNQPETYSSDMVIYTGLATGINIESGSDARYDLFGTNAAFDNLLNIIRSRQTQEETAIRLMAQHLMLEQPDPRYCTKATWDAIHNEAPMDLKALVHYDPSYLSDEGYELQRAGNDVREDSQNEQETPGAYDTVQTKTISETRYESRQVTEKVKKFRTEPKYYTVKAGDYPVGIARKFNISLEELKQLNQPFELPLHGGQRLKVGAASTPYYVDTLVTREFPVEVEVEIPVNAKTEELVGSTQGSRSDPLVRMDSISENFEQIYDEANKHVEAFEKTVSNLIRYKEKDERNHIYSTLQSSNPVYSVDKISKVRATRLQNSDLLRLTFDSNDPGVCQQTLRMITQVFTKQHQSIKGAQTSMVSDYFRDQVNKAKKRLDSLEDINLEFRKKNRIINYNEQTKFIAEQNEVLDRDWYDESSNLSAAQSSLLVLEQQMDDYSKNLTEREEIMRLRQDLGQTMRLITMEEAEVNPDIEILTRLKRKHLEIKNELEDFMARSFDSHRTTEGIDMQTVLLQWLAKVVEVEESNAKYKVKTQQKADFMKKYDLYAPLGSELTKLERQIELAQQEYLDHWHSLSLSLLRQKNNEQSSIEVMDDAYFPIKPNPSKRMFTVIAAFMAGLFITAGLIIFLEFIDSSIKLPQRAAELTKSKLIGAYPKVPRKTDGNIHYDVITTRLIDMISQKIKLDELQREEHIDRPFLVLLLSTRRNEGKTYLGSKLAKKFRSVGHRVLYIKPHEAKHQDQYVENRVVEAGADQVWDFEYNVPDNFMSIRSINELLRNFTFMTKGYQYIFLELPALLLNDYPAALAASADLSLLVCRATRAWNQADDEVLEIFKSNSKQTVYALLNGCQVDHLEPIIGEIPKKRSVLRIVAKKVINFDFKQAHSF